MVLGVVEQVADRPLSSPGRPTEGAAAMNASSTTTPGRPLALPTAARGHRRRPPSRRRLRRRPPSLRASSRRSSTRLLQPGDLLEHAAMRRLDVGGGGVLEVDLQLSARPRQRRSSCEASATKRRCRRCESSTRASMSFIVVASRPISSSVVLDPPAAVRARQVGYAAADRFDRVQRPSDGDPGHGGDQPQQDSSGDSGASRTRSSVSGQVRGWCRPRSSRAAGVTWRATRVVGSRQPHRGGHRRCGSPARHLRGEWQRWARGADVGGGRYHPTPSSTTPPTARPST